MDSDLFQLLARLKADVADSVYANSCTFFRRLATAFWYGHSFSIG